MRYRRVERVEDSAHLPGLAHGEGNVRDLQVGRGGRGVHVQRLLWLGRPPDELGHVSKPVELGTFE